VRAALTMTMDSDMGYSCEDQMVAVLRRCGKRLSAS
jgi:hypothetical protein